MTTEKIRTRKQDRITSLYQVDPGFYNKILSRSNSVGHSNRISVYRSPGQVPFTWETEPGKPRDEPKIRVSPPIRFPPAIRSSNMPRPCIPPTGPKAYILKKIKKVKKIQKIKGGLSPSIHNLSVTRPKINPEEVKVYVLKNIKKVKKIKKLKRINLGKLMKGKHREKTGGGHHHGNAKSTYNSSHYGMYRNDYGFEFSTSPDTDDFIPTVTTSSDSSRTSYFSSFSFANVIKPPKLLRFWSLSMELMKWRSNNKSTKRTYSF